MFFDYIFEIVINNKNDDEEKHEVNAQAGIW